MTKCSDCYWSEQCGCLTITCCEDYTPLTDDQSADEAAYLANVRADYEQWNMTDPDVDDVGSVSYKLRDSAQHLLI